MSTSPASIDFERMSPERVRGVRAPKEINWAALRMAVNNSIEAGEGQISPLKRERLWTKVRKQIGETGLEGMDPRLRYNYCRARLTMGDFSDYWGWEFRDFGSNGASWAAHMYWEETWLPKWGGGNCNRLLVLGEQGIGDSIFVASVLPDAMIRCREVIFECDDRLHKLLERSLPGLVCRSERKFEDRRTDYGVIDAFIPSFELLRMFRRSKTSFPGLPFLKADPSRIQEVARYRGRVGVSWTARQGSIDPTELGLAHPISVQYKHFHREIEQPQIDLFHDIEGITALCAVLQKVVCVPTSVHHIAGALGQRVEIIVPEVKNKEAENLSPWDYSTLYNDGKLLWYADAQVYKDVASWKAAR
jgi:hypothetical protein